MGMPRVPWYVPWCPWDTPRSKYIYDAVHSPMTYRMAPTGYIACHPFPMESKGISHVRISVSYEYSIPLFITAHHCLPYGIPRATPWDAVGHPAHGKNRGTHGIELFHGIPYGMVHAMPWPPFHEVCAMCLPMGCFMGFPIGMVLHGIAHGRARGIAHGLAHGLLLYFVNM